MNSPQQPVEATTWLPVSSEEAFCLVTDPALVQDRRLR